MSSGSTHGAVAVAFGLAQAASSHAALAPGDAMVGLTLAAGMLPDVDRSTSLAGRLVPQTIAPTESEWVVTVPGISERFIVKPGTEVPDGCQVKVRTWRRIGRVRIAHRGPTHSLFVGMVLAAPWLWVGHPEYARAVYQGWLSHLALDGGSKQELFWPFSRLLPWSWRWVQLWPFSLAHGEMAVQAAAIGVILATLAGRLWG